MHWIAAAVVLLGVVVRYATGRRRAAVRKSRMGTSHSSSVTETCDAQDIDAVIRDGSFSQWVALASRNLPSVCKEPLLERIVDHAYRRRYDPDMLAAVLSYGPLLIDLVLQSPPGADVTRGEHRMQRPCFKQFAIALEECSRYAEAIAVCENALHLGIADGTQSGFEGRIARLKKKSAA